MFNVIIIGAEETDDYHFFKEKVISILRNKAKSGCGITIYTTGDAFVDYFSKQYKIDIRFFATDWTRYGRDAIKERNKEMLKTANAIIFFQNSRKDYVTLFNKAMEKNLSARLIKAKS